MAGFFSKKNTKQSVSRGFLSLFMGVFSFGVLAIGFGSSSNASDFQSPRTMALGGAGHAGPMLNDAIYLNPSFTSFLPSYSVSANYLFYNGPGNPDGTPSDPHGHNLNVSLQDGRSELFQAGVGLSILEDRKVISFGASKSIVQRFGVGFGGKFVVPNTNSPTPLWDSIVSVTGVPIDWLQLAGIVDNILESQSGLPYGLFREYTLGTKINISGMILLYFDPHYTPHADDGTQFGHELGIEIPIMQDFFIRVGNFRNSFVPSLNQRGRGYAAGIGWIAPRISFDYGISRMLEPVSTTTHTIGFTIYF